MNVEMFPVKELPLSQRRLTKVEMFLGRDESLHIPDGLKDVRISSSNMKR